MMTDKELVIEKLKSLTDKKYIYFLNSGDEATFYLMNHLKERGFKKILIPDAGGWFSYRKYPKKLDLGIIEIKTDDSLINIRDFEDKCEAEGFALVNSMGGYFVVEPMKDIEDICRRKYSILINDVSASIGSQAAKYGHFCVGSFGDAKPISLGIGGFIGSDTELEIDKSAFEVKDDFSKLSDEISSLNKKLHYWSLLRNKVIIDLKESDVLHKESDGINIVAAYENDDERENLINYCDKNELEYVLCPNYIKVNRKAVSIEIKRKKEVLYVE